MSICHCRPVPSMAEMVKKPTPPGMGISTPESWYCIKCDGFHHAAQEPVPIVRAPANARACLHAMHHQNGQRILTWAVGDGGEKVDTVEFYPWGRRNPMSQTEPMLYTLWELLMSKLPTFMDAGPEDPWTGDQEKRKEQEQAKYQARGIAEALAIIMKPFLSTGDEVVRAAVKKYKDPSYEVPGLAEYLWDPMRNPDGSMRTPVATPKTAAAKPAAAPKRIASSGGKKLKPEEIEGIKTALESGMFTEDDVAGMFKVSVETVRAAVSS